MGLFLLFSEAKTDQSRGRCWSGYALRSKPDQRLLEAARQLGFKTIEIW